MKAWYSPRLIKWAVEKVSRAFVGRQNRPDVFISATSADLGSVRKVVRDALLDSDCFPVEQSHFAPDYRKVEEMLRARIGTCQAVIHLVGMRYGFEPKPEHRPPNTPRRSYTQMEYYIAKELGIRCYTFICPEDFPYDESGTPESEELREFQLAHRRQLLGADDLFTEFTDCAELAKSILKMQTTLSELRAGIDKNGIRLWFAVLMNWVILILLVGGIWWGINRVGRSTESIIREMRKNSAAEKVHAQAAADSIIQELRRDSSPERLQAQAATLFDGRNYSAAFHLYLQLSDAEPWNVELHRRIEECARKGSLKEAFLARYLALVSQQPTNAIFRNYLGNARLLIDPEDKDGTARSCYEMALQCDPALTPAMHNLGVVLFRGGKLDPAEAHFRAYLAIHPEDADVWVNLGLLDLTRVRAEPGNRQAIGSAMDAFQKALQLAPGSASAHKALGGLYLAIGQTNEALRAYQTSLALDPDQPWVRALMADRFPGASDQDTPSLEAVTRSLEHVGSDTTPARVQVDDQ